MIVNISKVTISLGKREIDNEMLLNTIAKLAMEVHKVDCWATEKAESERSSIGKPSSDDDKCSEATASSENGKGENDDDDSKEESVNCKEESEICEPQIALEKNIVLDM
jgi:hypothetical protein